MRQNTRRVVIAFVAIFAALTLTGCGVATQASIKKLQVGAGPLDNPQVKGCIEPGVLRKTPTNDDYYAYPVSDRDMDATGQAGSDFDMITAISSDNAEMAIPVIIRFNMVTECDTLGKFFKAYGQRYSAYLNDDGTATEGWRLMLRKLMYDPTDALLDDVAKNYEWRELYNDASAQTELQEQLTDNIQSIVEKNARGIYFENFTVLVKKPVPTNPDLVNAIASEQAEVGKAQAAEARARAQKIQAEAEVAVAKAQAEKQQAEIEGFGGYENYSRSQAIQKGLNPFQPTYIVSGTGPR